MMEELHSLIILLRSMYVSGTEENYLDRDILKELLDTLKECNEKINDLEKKLKEEKDYRQYLQDRRIKGQLAGYLVMLPEEVNYHHVTEDLNRQASELRKIANNPALSYHTQTLIHQQINNIFSLLFWRSKAIKLSREKAKHET